MTDADEIRRLARENHILKLGAEAWPEILKDRDERLAALAQSNADDPGDATWRNLKKRMDMGTKEAIAQSDAEPVAWRWCYRSRPDEWHFVVNKFTPNGTQIMEPLFAAPPRPDASAGLTEAAEWLEQRAPACYAATTAREWAAELRKEVAVRARAADKEREMTDSTPADRAYAYLCHVLRANARSLPSFQGDLMVKAADEIERLPDRVRAAFEEAAQIADSFGDRHEEFEPGDAIRARARIGK